MPPCHGLNTCPVPHGSFSLLLTFADEMEWQEVTATIALYNTGAMISFPSESYWQALTTQAMGTFTNEVSTQLGLDPIHGQDDGPEVRPREHVEPLSLVCHLSLTHSLSAVPWSSSASDRVRS